MAHRRLKRQLSLMQVLMLGTAGTIAAEIFVLTGHVAGLSGPASTLALLLVGVLAFSVALNYCEMGTAFPETGGALTFVREAFGSGLLSFLTGSLDILSSVFYAALSAVGFAYSVAIFVPHLPIVPVALFAIAVFTFLNILGVSSVGRVQLWLGGSLVTLLGVYVVAGFVSPKGFHLDTFVPDGRFFIGDGFSGITAGVLGTMALIFNAYVGFELIVADGEEIVNPSRNIPRGILYSLVMVTVLYCTIALVTLGTVPWTELAGREDALAIAAARFMPRWGAPLVAVAGIIATLTSVNAAILSSIREVFTMSRDGVWPRLFSRMGRRRQPVAAALVIGALAMPIAAIGEVDFLSYISSSGFLFVVFWATMAMLRLRRDRPELRRPFRVPFYPLTPIVAAAACVLVVLYTDGRALLFGVGVLVVLTLLYYARGPIAAIFPERTHTEEMTGDRLLVAVSNPHTAEGLANLALALAKRADNTSVLFLDIVPLQRRLLPRVAQRFLARIGQRQREMLARVAKEMEEHNIPFYTRSHYASDVAQGILNEVVHYGNDKLILMGWPGALTPETLAQHPVRRVLQQAPTNVAVFLDRGLSDLRSILVPVGNSHHARLALRVALELAEGSGAEVTAVRCFCGGDSDDMYDDLLALRELIETEFGDVPPELVTRVIAAPSVLEGIQTALVQRSYDLVVIGAAMAYAVQSDLFGSVTDQVAETIPCSVLLVRRYEPVMMRWLRRTMRHLVGV